MIKHLKMVNASIKHVDLLTDYRMKLWKDAGKFKSPNEFEHIYNLNKEYFINHFESDRIIAPIFLDPSDGSIVSIGIGVIVIKPIVNLENMGLEGYIFNMHTEESYRCKGLATKILNEIFQFFKEKQVFKVSLNANESSFNLYKKMGMKANQFHLELKL